MREASLQVSHLNAWYGQAQALFDVSLSVEAGEWVGENGTKRPTVDWLS